MAWYWWLLIAVAVVGIGAVKMVVLKKIMAKKQAERAVEEED